MVMLMVPLALLIDGSYDPAGRRDPFVPWGAPILAPPRTCAASGLGGMSIAQVSLAGVVRVHDRFVALVRDEQGRSWPAVDGARLCDGVVDRVSAGQVELSGPSRGIGDPARHLVLKLHPET